MTPENFEKEIAKAMKRLPNFLLDAADGAGVAVLAGDRAPKRPEDQPGDALFAEFIGPTSAEFDSGDSPFPPTVILYRETFESECDTAAELREEIYRTLIHELGHFLGFEEEDLEDV